jgi:hypothetical protein
MLLGLYLAIATPQCITTLFLDPRTKPLLKDILTNQHLSQLKKDIVNLMVDEGEHKKQIQIDNDNEERNTERKGSETKSVNITATAASHRVASMFQGLNTMSAEQDEDNEDEEEDMIRNICYAEFQRYKKCIDSSSQYWWFNQ